jgi:hypothetical protein
MGKLRRRKRVGFRIGFNLDGGIDYKLILNAELKYKIGSDWNRLLLSAGLDLLVLVES